MHTTRQPTEARVRLESEPPRILTIAEYVALPIEEAEAYPVTLIDERGEPIRAEAA